MLHTCSITYRNNLTLEWEYLLINSQLANLQLYGVCWTGSESVLTGGSQQHVATVVNTKTDEVSMTQKLYHGVYGSSYSMYGDGMWDKMGAPH